MRPMSNILHSMIGIPLHIESHNSCLAYCPQDHHPDDAHPLEPNQEYHGEYADGFVTPAMDEHAPFDPEQGRVVIKFKVTD